MSFLYKLSYDKDTGHFTWVVGPLKGKRAGCMNKDGYWVIRVYGTLYYAHRLAYMKVNGTPPTLEIDHLNGVRDDNRWSNLREVTSTVNKQNVRAARSSNAHSGLLGVMKNGRNWAAQIIINGSRKCLGTYSTPEEAHQAYITAKRQHHEGCTV